MDLLKLFCKRFKCNSKCSYNDEPFDPSHLQRRLTNYSLKNKDVQKILRILHKRDRLNDVPDVVRTAPNPDGLVRLCKEVEI